MTNPYIERAAKVIKDVCRASASWQQAADELDSAGLLVTPLHERALEAYATLMACVSEHTMADAARMGLVAGRESLALKEKAKGQRFVVAQRGATRYFDVRDTSTSPDNPYAHNLTESQARRVALALNECDD